MKFTLAELYEIERMSDQHATLLVSQMAEFAYKIDKLPGSEKLMDKVFEEHCKAWDALRTISAKCRKLQEERTEVN